MIKYDNNIVFRPEKLDALNIDRQTIALIPANSKVLEIGCATGVMGKFLKKYKKCEVTGVELRQEEAGVAKKNLDNVITGNIEDKDIFNKITGKFDVVLAVALIQQLKTPEESLKNWKKFLKKDGYLIITASNIAHWTTRKELFLGKFNYEDYGLLDDSHLRFYTIKTFKDLVINAGFEIIEFKIDPVGGGYPKVSKLLSNILPSLFTYQMLIYAKGK